MMPFMNVLKQKLNSFLNYILKKGLSSRGCFLPDMKKWILVWFQQDNVTLGTKYEGKECCAGSQDREYFHSHHDLPFSAVVDRKKGDPDTEEHQHTEWQKFGFIECIWQISRQEGHSITPKGHEAEVSQDWMEGNSWALVAQNDDMSILRMSILVNEWWGCCHPYSTNKKLDQGAYRNDVVWPSWYH